MRMLTKSKIILMISVSLALLLSVISYNQIHSHQQKEKKIVKISASRIPVEGDLNENLKKTDAIVLAKITGSNSYLMGGIAFTDYNLQIEKEYKSKLKSKLNDICISMNGGIIGDTEYIVDGAKQLEIGSTYLLFLNKRYPDNPNSNQYCAAYGDIGIIKVEKEKGETKVYKGVEFNPNNKFENSVKNKNVEEVVQEICK